jgi:hypothetical protein
MRRTLLLLVLLVGGCTSGFVIRNATPERVACMQTFLTQEETRFFTVFPEARRPAGPLVFVMTASYAEFEAYGRRVDKVNVGWMISYYSPMTKEAVIIAGVPDRILSHELAHQLADLGGLNRREFWFTEGLATNFEQNDDRLWARLLEAKREGRLLPLDVFGSMTGAGVDPLDSYAEAWGVFRYLLLTHRTLLFSGKPIDLAVYQQDFERFIDYLR